MVIKKTTYKDQVVDYIYKEILKENIKPKEQVKESHLSEVLQISRAPIREALKELIGIGILEYKPRVGTFVVDLSPKDTLNAYITRGVLEGYAASQVCRQFGDEMIDRLYTMCDEMEILAKEGKNIELIDLGDRFHEEIFLKCSNNQLVSFTKTLSIKSHLMFSRYWPKLYLPNEINKRHRLIVDAIKNKNPKSVEEMVRNHYLETGKKIAELKEKGE